MGEASKAVFVAHAAGDGFSVLPECPMSSSVTVTVLATDEAASGDNFSGCFMTARRAKDSLGAIAESVGLRGSSAVQILSEPGQRKSGPGGANIGAWGTCAGVTIADGASASKGR